jgi:hypothetical protein
LHYIREKKAVIQAKAGPDMVEKRNKEEKNRKIRCRIGPNTSNFNPNSMILMLFS